MMDLWNSQIWRKLEIPSANVRSNFVTLNLGTSLDQPERSCQSPNSMRSCPPMALTTEGVGEQEHAIDISQEAPEFVVRNSPWGLLGQRWTFTIYPFSPSPDVHIERHSPMYDLPSQVSIMPNQLFQKRLIEIEYPPMTTHTGTLETSKYQDVHPTIPWYTKNKHE